MNTSDSRASAPSAAWTRIAKGPRSSHLPVSDESEVIVSNAEELDNVMDGAVAMENVDDSVEDAVDMVEATNPGRIGFNMDARAISWNAYGCVMS